MVDTPVFETICCGGPLDGQCVIETYGREGFVYQTNADGIGLMPGDEVMGPASSVVGEKYRVFTLMISWPECTWCYVAWVHESLLPAERESRSRILERLHLCDCYVERMPIVSELEAEKLFDLEAITQHQEN